MSDKKNNALSNLFAAAGFVLISTIILAGGGALMGCLLGFAIAGPAGVMLGSILGAGLGVLIGSVVSLGLVIGTWPNVPLIQWLGGQDNSPPARRMTSEEMKTPKPHADGPNIDCRSTPLPSQIPTTETKEKKPGIKSQNK